MSKQIKLAVAAALLAAASSANAGIMIPAGDWTLDIGGVVNAYYTTTRATGDTNVGFAPANIGNNGNKTTSNITTGLLPNYLSVSGKTRQNDLDVAFTISINPGASTTQSGEQGANQENRQAFLTFGDKSWGSIKLGKDLGIYASDAILNDMTLLGVGSAAGGLAGNTTTLGRIGTGFMYADWKSQIAYSSPNWNGFSFTAGLTQGWDAQAFNSGLGSNQRSGAATAYEGKASYEWTGDVAGKVWVSGITQKVVGMNDRAESVDIGATASVAGFGLTGYYYTGSGIGQTLQLLGGFDAVGNARDSNGGYVQGTYTIPGVGTKLGLSWGQSKLDTNGGADVGGDVKDTMWTIGAYHPLTKHLNLVAEYSDVKHEISSAAAPANNGEGKSKTVSLGAILFF
ncbi:MAG: porin [Pseudomonadota bacterium]